MYDLGSLYRISFKTGVTPSSFLDPEPAPPP